MRRYFIKTYGCQQNVNDSEILSGILESMGYSEALQPEDADVILVNTCTVRQKAENKAYGYINNLKRLKDTKTQRPITIGICGCLPQQEQTNLLQKFPFVDFIVGPANIHDIREVLDKRESKSIVLTETCNPETRNLPQKRAQDVTAYISIMYGCNNFCSFCIVPYVRGREVSRSEKDILNEIKGLNKKVFKEVVLLGQNVNSYRPQDHKTTRPQDQKVVRSCGPAVMRSGLAGLLERVHKIDGLERIRFLTSHPKDMSVDIIQAVKELPKVCEFFHLPLQSGDDQVLKNMNRGYTSEYYRSLIKKIRKAIPDAAITSDVVVGFPGETEEQFEHTLYMIGDIGFDAVNTAAYSVRPKTKAAELPGHLSDEVKKARLNKVMKVVEETAWMANQKLVGKTVEVLVDKSGTGRTRGNKIVKFDGGESLVGQLVNVKIREAKSWVLKGSRVK